MKKITALLFGFMLAVCLFNGCRSADSGEKDNEIEEAEKETVYTVLKKTVQLGTGPAEVEVVDIGKSGTFSYWSCFTGDCYDWELTRVAAFNEAYRDLGIQVQVQQVPDGAGILDGKLLAAIASGTGPDLLVTDKPTSAYQFAAEGSFMSLDHVLDDVGLEVDDFFEGCKDCMFYDGTCYLVPQDTNVILLYIRKDIAEEAGLDLSNLPKTRDELDEWAGKMTVSNGDGYDRIGFIPWLDSGDDAFTVPFIMGAEPYADGKINLTDEAMVSYMEWVQSYAKKYDPTKINAFTSGLGGMFSPDHAFMTGKVGMTITGNWFTEALREYAPDVEYVVCPVPVNELGRARSTCFGCNVFAIPTGTDKDKAELAALYIRFCEQGVINEENFAEWRSIPVIDAAFDQVSLTIDGDEIYALEREIANSPKNGIPALCAISAELSDKFRALREQIIHDTALVPAEQLFAFETEMQMLLDSK